MVRGSARARAHREDEAEADEGVERGQDGLGLRVLAWSGLELGLGLRLGLGSGFGVRFGFGSGFGSVFGVGVGVRVCEYGPLTLRVLAER